MVTGASFEKPDRASAVVITPGATRTATAAMIVIGAESFSVARTTTTAMTTASVYQACQAIRLSAGRRWLGRPVDAALLYLVVLPPPAAGALVLSRGGGAGAGLAADRRVALVVERVVRHVVVPDVVPHLGPGPARERGDLRDPVVLRVG